MNKFSKKRNPHAGVIQLLFLSVLYWHWTLPFGHLFENLLLLGWPIFLRIHCFLSFTIFCAICQSFGSSECVKTKLACIFKSNRKHFSISLRSNTSKEMFSPMVRTAFCQLMHEHTQYAYDASVHRSVLPSAFRLYRISVLFFSFFLCSFLFDTICCMFTFFSWNLNLIYVHSVLKLIISSWNNYNFKAKLSICLTTLFPFRLKHLQTKAMEFFVFH